MVAGEGFEPSDLRVMSPTSYQLLHPAVLFLWVEGKDLNLQSDHATDLQSAPFGHLGTPPLIAKLIILQLHSPVNTYFGEPLLVIFGFNL